MFLVFFNKRVWLKAISVSPKPQLLTLKLDLMKRITVLLGFLVLLGLQVVFAQTKQITGTVTSAEDGMGIPGVSVVVKGTTLGVTTDIDGKYTLSNVPQNAEVIVFSFIGLKTIEMPASQSVINVIMESDSQELEEVVVTAYGTQKRSSLTGAIASVDAKKLERIPTSDVSKALEGAIAGVTISSASGTPGQDTRIRIRGIGSLNASSAPLIIVDGSPYDGSINTINPSDIESYNVLKDAASAALYGARGANGVIIIKTKQGRKGQTVVNFDGKVGYNFRGVPEYDMVTDPARYYELAWQSLYNVARFDPNYIIEGGVGRPATASEAATYASQNLYTQLGGYPIYKGISGNAIVGIDGRINPNAKDYIFEDSDWNDWEKALFKPQMRQEYNLSISKGNDNSLTFFSLGYLTDEGYNMNSYFDRLTSRLNHKTDIYNWLKFSNNIQFTATKRNVNASGSTMANTFYFLRSMPPIHPIYKHDAEGKIMYDIDGNKVYEDGKEIPGVSLARKELNNLNVVASQNDDMDRTNSYVLNNAANLTAILPWDIIVSTNATYTGEFYRGTYRQAPFGDAAMYHGRIRKWNQQQDGFNFNQIVDWNTTLVDGTINLALKAGHESYSAVNSYMRGQKSMMFDVWDEELNNAAKLESLTSYSYQYRLEGYFGQVSADYLNKYYFSFSARRDGSSVFHPDHRWGNFWSTGLSWRISNEEFFTPLRNVVDNLKLRVSYGAQGNDYLYLPNGTRSWTPYQNLYEVTSDGTNYGVVSTNMGNKEITWEKNMNFNAALEFSVLQNLISGEVEFFQRTTSDMLFNIPVLASTGFQTKPINIGEMKNTGVELTLRANIIKSKDINWSIDANITHFKNELTKLPEEFRKTGIRRGSQLLLEGKSIYEFSMVKFAGVDPATGNSLYWMRGKDAEGNLQEFTAQPWNANLLGTSYQFVGSALPDMQGGFGTLFEAHGFDMSMQFSYGIGGKVLDNTYAKLMNPSSFGQAYHKDLHGSWSESNGIVSSTLPRLEKDNRDLEQSTERYLTDASYFAFRNIMVGYSLPSKWIARTGLGSLRVYGVIDNVNLWSARKGLDPRMFLTGSGDYVYSPMRTVSVGLSMKF